MKNLFKNSIFMFFLGFIMTLGLTTFAALKSADDIVYKETNVKSELDSLYEKSAYTEYSGLTTITPSTTTQTLETNNTLVKSNITINAVPSYTPSTISPSSTVQTLETSNKMATDNIIIEAIPSNYKNLSTSTNFTASDIFVGKKAYNSNGELITGTAASTITTTKTLLWTNPNPNDSIALSYVTLNSSLSNYSHFLVIYKNYKTDTRTYENIFKVKAFRFDGDASTAKYDILGKSGSSIYSRGIFIPSGETGERIKFGGAYQTSDGNSRDNNYLIPIYIYGLNLSY